MATATGSAWEDTATLKSWRRLRRVGRVWFAVGVALMVGFGVYNSRIHGHADWLVAHGVRTAGVVLEDHGLALRCGRVPVPVRFSVDCKQQVHDYFVDGCGGDGLHKGKRVTISYNAAEPNDFVINGKANEQPLPTLLSLIAFVAGAFFVGGWALRGRRLHLLRRVLSANGWQPRRVIAARFPSPWTKGRSAIQLVERDARTILVTQPLIDGWQGAISETALTAGERGLYALQGTGRRSLVLARPPRMKASMRRARDALNGVDGTTLPGEPSDGAQS